MQYRSIADMNETIVKNLHRLPRDIDLVVGVPRSGLLAANLLGLAANIPTTDLDSFVLARERSHLRKVLVIDDSIDSIDTGTAVSEARAKVAASGTTAEVVFSAVYGTSGEHEQADIVFEIVPKPRVFQWNFMHHELLEQSCVDIDGVLCLDPTNDENDDGPAYARFLAEARPLYGPTRRIGYLVTSRLEKYRPQTEAWLAARGILYDKLVMLDLPSKAERQRLAAHGSFKAEVYRGCDAVLFIESEYDQALKIANGSGKPVLCLQNHQLIMPDIGTVTEHSPKPVGSQTMLKLAARAILGQRRYEALKRRVSARPASPRGETVDPQFRRGEARP